MVDLKILTERGITAEKLRKLWEGQAGGTIEDETKRGKLTNLRNRLRDRIRKGREECLSTWQIFHALDLAWDLPFQQAAPTLLNSILDKDYDSPEVQSALKAVGSWNFRVDQILTRETDDKSGAVTTKLNVPAFFMIGVPLVKAYLTIRWAKIMNDRRLMPFLKYEPAISSRPERAKCEVLTNRVEAMSRQFGYFSTVKKEVFNMLHYHESIAFPVEEWFTECQECSSNTPGSMVIEESEPRRHKRIEKEGIRWHVPHPSRTYKDDAYPAWTMNTDTGCEYGGYWRIFRWRDIRHNESFFNRDKVSIGDTAWWNSASAYFKTFYKCAIRSPEVSSWTGARQDRESKMEEQLYTSHHDDQSVVLTEHYDRLVPSEWGLGDYDFPVWFRFVVAADDTIMYNVPVGYGPMRWMGYDVDDARSVNSSLSLEILPAQDQLSILMTQFVLAAKQNLANVTFANTDVLDETWIKKIINLGQKFITGLNLIPASFKTLKKRVNDDRAVKEAFMSFKFPYMDTNALLQAMKVILDVLERQLTISSQEVGQAASHELKVEEIRNIAGATSTRLQFTSNTVDDGIERLKGQVYEGLMNYGQDEFYAQIPSETLIDEEVLKEMGITYADDETNPRTGKQRAVKVKKKAMLMLSFTQNRDHNDRSNNGEAAVQMMNAIVGVLKVPEIAGVIGAPQFLELFNQIFRMAGFPRDFKLRETGQGMMDPQKLGQAMIEMAEQIKQEMMTEIQQGIVPLAEKQQEIAAIVGQIQQALQMAPAVDEPLSMEMPGSPPAYMG